MLESMRLLRRFARCCQNSLLLCKEYGLKSIAFPAISCGVYGYPADKAAEVSIIVAAARRVLGKYPHALFVCGRVTPDRTTSSEHAQFPAVVLRDIPDQVVAGGSLLRPLDSKTQHLARVSTVVILQVVNFVLFLGRICNAMECFATLVFLSEVRFVCASDLKPAVKMGLPSPPYFGLACSLERTHKAYSSQRAY